MDCVWRCATMMSVRPEVVAILKRILETESPVISLDFIGEVIGIEAVSAKEIDELFEGLETAGRIIGTLTPNLREHLGRVLREARQLKNAQQATPDVAAIAESAHLTPGEVRAALLYASVLSRESF
jgi:hypothetical protein